MMEYQYISYGYLQNYLRDYYLGHKKKLILVKAIQNVIHSEKTSYYSPQVPFSRLWSYLSDEEFIDLISKLELLLVEPPEILKAQVTYLYLISFVL